MRRMTSHKTQSGRWTRTTRRFAACVTFVAIAVIVGCQRPSEIVWVDLSRVAFAREPRPVLGHVPGSEFSLPPGQATIAGIEPSMRGRETVEERRLASRALMEHQFATLQSELEENYLRVVLADARAEIAAIRRSQSGDMRSRADTAMEEISHLVQSNAASRAQMIFRAALIVGWPKIRGYSERELSRSKLLRDWDAEGRALHARISENERMLDETMVRILRSVDQLNEQQAAAIEAEVRAILRRADQRAAQMTRERLEETKRADLPPLLESDYIAAQPQTSRVASLPGVQARMGASEAPPFQEGPVIPAHLEEKLDIFLRVHGYKLGGSTSTDKTAEFIAWLKNP